MTTYEERRQAHLATWSAALPDRLERVRWPRERIEQARDDAVRRLVAHARAASPWHAGRLAGVDVDALRASDLTALPTMTKADLMANFDDVVTDRRISLAAAEAHLAGLDDDAYFADDLHVVASGGSSGERGVFVYGWDAWVDVHLGLGRCLIADVLAHAGTAGDGPGVTAMVAAANATHMTTAVGRTFASPMVETHPFPVTRPLADTVAGLNRVRPSVLIAYASMLGVLAAEASAGRLRIEPRRIVATSEPLLPEIRMAAEAAFGVAVANAWGTSEGGVMALGCWQSDGMHVFEDLVVIEPVDADGQPVPPGTTSAKVLVTNLYNPTLPLIRYEVTDEVAVLDEPCPCGSAYVRVADVQGRCDDAFRYASTTVHPHVLRSVLGRHPAVVDYQVHQTSDGADVAVVPAGAVDTGALADQLTAALRGAGLPGAVVTVGAVDALARHRATGKLKRFVPLAAQLSDSA